MIIVKNGVSETLNKRIGCMRDWVSSYNAFLDDLIVEREECCGDDCPVSHQDAYVLIAAKLIS